jgi:hypothetical protein
MVAIGNDREAGTPRTAHPDPFDGLRAGGIGAEISLRNDWLVVRPGAFTLLREEMKAAMGSVAAGALRKESWRKESGVGGSAGVKEAPGKAVRPVRQAHRWQAKGGGGKS